MWHFVTPSKHWAITSTGRSPGHFAGPWVTSVGGTYNFPEVASELSGGGFSESFERPEYQRNAVGAYLIDFQMEPDSNFNYFKCAYCRDLTFT